MNAEIDIKLSFDELLGACSGERQWLLSLIEEEVIVINGLPEEAEFSGFHLARVRRAQRISRDFDASIPALGLIMRLLDEVQELRKSKPVVSLLDDI